MSEHGVKRCLAAATVLLVGSCLGCGTGRYEERLEETVKRLGQESVFSGMHPPTDLPGTAVTVQLPQFFGESPLPENSDARRLQPPEIEVPDLKLTYEGSITESVGGKQHFYCYLAATRQDPQRQLQRQFQTAFPATVTKWEDADCKTADGGTVKWKKLQGVQAEGQTQEFYYVDKEGQESFRKMPAAMLLHLRKVGDLFLVVGWRMPATLEKLIGVEGDLGLKQWAPRVAGSIQVKE